MVGSSVTMMVETMSSEKLAKGSSVVTAANGNYFDPLAVVSEPVPESVGESAVTSGGVGDEDGLKVNIEKEEKKREIVLGRNVHTTCLAVTEPEADDESTGDKEAYMASVLARYKMNLTERTKHHLGMSDSFYSTYFSKFPFSFSRILDCYCSESTGI